MKSTLSRVAGILAVMAAVVVTGCDSDPVIPRIEDATFAPSLGIDLNAMTKSVTGLYYQNVVDGTGDPAGHGSRAWVHYTGWLADGTEFDASWPPEAPILVWIGSGNTIPGFAEGTRGMRVGGKRLIVVPPVLGYGGQTQGPIPANSILVFEIELVAVE